LPVLLDLQLSKFLLCKVRYLLFLLLYQLFQTFALTGGCAFGQYGRPRIDTSSGFRSPTANPAPAIHRWPRFFAGFGKIGRPDRDWEVRGFGRPFTHEQPFYGAGAGAANTL